MNENLRLALVGLFLGACSYLGTIAGLKILQYYEAKKDERRTG